MVKFRRLLGLADLTARQPRGGGERERVRLPAGDQRPDRGIRGQLPGKPADPARPAHRAAAPGRLPVVRRGGAGRHPPAGRPVRPQAGGGPAEPHGAGAAPVHGLRAAFQPLLAGNRDPGRPAQGGPVRAVLFPDGVRPPGHGLRQAGEGRLRLRQLPVQPLPGDPRLQHGRHPQGAGGVAAGGGRPRRAVQPGQDPGPGAGPGRGGGPGGGSGAAAGRFAAAGPALSPAARRAPPASGRFPARPDRAGGDWGR